MRFLKVQEHNEDLIRL